MNLTTTIHEYYFDIKTKEGLEKYNALKKRLCDYYGLGNRKMVSWGGDSHYHGDSLDGRFIELETKFLFNNQWNTAPIPGVSEKGLRVFDWAEDYDGRNTGIRKGHFLTQTDEMREIRDNTVKCGYCGAQEPAQKGYVFCPHCIDSEYLKESDLHLTRMLPVSQCGPKADRKPLTEAEKEHLLPIYRDAQVGGKSPRGKARTEKWRRRLAHTFNETIKNAEIEYKGFLWLIDHGFAPDNVIYYKHKDRFCFGWREPVTPEVESVILDFISEFPYDYEIKTKRGQTLSN